MSAWLVNSMDLEQPERANTGEQAPAHVMTNFVTRQYDVEGNLSQLLQGQQVTYFGPDQDTLVEMPYIVIYQNGAPHWFGTSERGRLSADGKNIYFLGDARLWQPSAVHEDKALEIISRDVLLRSAEAYVETTHHAIIRSPRGITEGIGLRAKTHAGQIELLADVKSILNPLDLP